MNFQGNFLHLGKVDISRVKALVSQLTEADWERENTRQKRYEVHKDTQFIGLVYDEDFRHMKSTKRPMLGRFAEALRPFFALIANYYENSPEIFAKFGKPVQGYFVRISLAKLLPGGHISHHQDKNFSLCHSHRVHIPIITNDKVAFNVGQETVNLKEGEVVEINNRRMHAVTNNSDLDRVHLILDWVFPWEPCCCSQKTHPGVPCSPQACVETDRLKTPCNCFPENKDLTQSSPALHLGSNAEAFDLKAAAQEATQYLSDSDVRAILAEPTIMLSAPRSGSTVIFEQMSGIEHFWTIGGESHAIFQAFPHLRSENAQLDSMVLDERHADPETCDMFRRCFLYFLKDLQGVPYLSLPVKDRPAKVTLLEKTPRNALNIAFLLKVFPDAKFIYLRRDARQTISSLIEAWTIGLKTGRFVTFTDLPNWPLPAWCFLLPRGWQALMGKPLADIAAFQWTESNRAIIEGLAKIPIDRWSSINYSDFVTNTRMTQEQMAQDIGFDLGDSELFNGELPLSRTTISLPDPHKWRRHEKEIEALLPEINAVNSEINRFLQLENENS